MDDLIMFLIFILIAVVNLVKTAIERKGRQQAPTQESGNEELPKNVPQPMKDFFDTLAEAFDMKPRPVVPDWPEGYERPDYMGEMEAYASDGFDDQLDIKQVVDEPVREFADVQPVMRVKAPAEKKIKHLRTSAFSLPDALSGLKGMRVPAFPVMRSATAGRLDYSLKGKADLKRTIIANIVLGAPRAYDRQFDNTAIK